MNVNIIIHYKHVNTIQRKRHLLALYKKHPVCNLFILNRDKTLNVVQIGAEREFQGEFVMRRIALFCFINKFCNSEECKEARTDTQNENEQ